MTFYKNYELYPRKCRVPYHNNKLNIVIINFSKKLDLTCVTQVCHKNTCFHVSAGRHRLAYVMYVQILQCSGMGRESWRAERESSRERIYSCIRLFREGSCGVAGQNIIGDTYGVQTYVGSAYWCVSQRTQHMSQQVGRIPTLLINSFISISWRFFLNLQQ